MDTSGSSSTLNTSEASQLLKEILQGNTGTSTSSLPSMSGSLGASGDGMNRNGSFDTSRGSNHMAELVNNLGSSGMPKQLINLQGNDTANSFSVYGRDVSIVASSVSSLSQKTPGSNKVKTQPVVNYDWENRYYTGNLVAIHRDGIHMAYVLTGKSGGVVRIINRKNAERALLKGFTGRVTDLSFAHHDHLIIAAVDEIGNFYVYQVDDLEDGKIITTCLLHVVRPPDTVPSDYHRVIWCPYIPDEEEQDDDENISHDVGKLLVVTSDDKAEIWSVDMVNSDQGSDPITPDNVDRGYLCIENHDQPIVDAAFSPDGTALATASLDGHVKFFQVYMQDKTSPRCLHEWVPHEGKPLSSLMFLDDHKHPNPEVQFWKFAITGADNNKEIKVWSCESWTCLQVIRFLSPLDVPSNFHVEPCIKSSLDLSANYMVLSDMKRKVLYILQVHQDPETGTAHVSSISEFLLTHPCLSLAVLDATRRRFKKTPEQANMDEMTTGEVDDEEEDVGEEDTVSVGSVVKLYTVQPKAIQELHIRFEPDSSVPQPPPASVSSVSHDDTAFRDGLTDISFDTVASSSDLDSKPKDSSQPFLLTPDAFTSSPRKSTDTVTSDTVRESMQSSNSSFTQITALNEALLSPDSSLTLTPSSSHVPTPTTLPLPPSTPGEEQKLIKTPEKSGIKNDVNSLEQMFGSPSASVSSKASKKPSEELEEMFSDQGGGSENIQLPSTSVEDLFDSQAQRRHLQSSSSSNASLEVSEILQAKGGSEDVVNEETDQQEEEDYNLRAWPKAPDVSAEAQRLAEEAIEQGAIEDQDDDVQIEEETEEPTARTDSSSEHDGVSSSSDVPRKTKLHKRMSPKQKQAKDGGPSIDSVVVEQLQDTMSQLLSMMKHQQQEILTLKSNLQSQQQEQTTMESGIAARVEAALEQYGQTQDLKLREVLSSSNQSKKGAEQQKLTAMSDTLTSSVLRKLDTAVKGEMRTTVVPAVTRILQPVQEQLHRDMAQKLTATDAVVKDSIGKMMKSRQTIDAIGQAAGNIAQSAIQSQFREAMQSNVIPSFERACQSMYAQVNESFQKGTKEYMRQLDNHMESVRRKQQEGQNPLLTQLQALVDHFKSNMGDLKRQIITDVKKEVDSQLKQSVNRLQESLSSNLRKAIRQEISDVLRDHHANLEDTIVQAVRTTAATPVPMTTDPHHQQTQILQLLRQGQLNSAFQQALSAADLHLVMFVCESVDPAQVFNQSPCPLQQPVLLSLIQQLSADLTSNTELRHKYLEEAIMNLDKSHPLTSEHMPAVLNGLCQKLMEYLQSGQNDQMTRPMKKLLMITQSLLK